VLKWTVGAIEVVALIVFLGYIFTFNLHIAHAYIHAPGQPEAPVSTRRFHMVRYALVAVGQSLLGSATTSIGCALFLAFCTLLFFVKFGLVIIIVTVLALLYSLLFLPALLMLCGPTTPRRGCCGAQKSQPSLLSEEVRPPGLLEPVLPPEGSLPVRLDPQYEEEEV